MSLPEDDEDSESGSERVLSGECANDSDTSSDGSSEGREDDAKQKKKISNYSSSGSSDEDSDVEEKQVELQSNASLSDSSSDERSGIEERRIAQNGSVDSDSTNEEDSDVGEKQSAQNGNGVSVSDSSDEDDSDVEMKRNDQSDSSASYSDNSDDDDGDLDSKRSVQNDSSDSSSGSSNYEGSDAEVKQRSQRGNSSSDSSSDEDSDLEEKQSAQNDENSGGSSSSDSSRSGDGGDESSASEADSSESEESESEQKPHPGKMKKSQQKALKRSPVKLETKKAVVAKKRAANASTKSENRVLKRLKRPDDTISDEDSSDEDSSDEDSDVAVDRSPVLKNLDIQQEDDDNNTESEREEEVRDIDTDEDENWPPQNDKEDEGRRKRDDIVGNSDEEWMEESDEVKRRPRVLISSHGKGINDLNQAKYLMRNIFSHVPLIEESAIRRGVKLSGPPLEFATTHQDEFARKFRWPQHFRNLRNRDFSQDPSDILEDHELLSELQQTEAAANEEKSLKESPFAQVPRPVVSMAAEALRRSLRKRRCSSGNEDSGAHAPSAVALLNTARVGGQFGDQFVESLLSANGKALQGIIDSDRDYDKRCWSSLPTKRKPIANWRFVLEHVRRTMSRSGHDNDSVYPPMKQETLERITKRLKTLYGHTTRHEECDIFTDTSPDTSNNSADIGE
ncbi:hypothetical protein P3T76_008746 [Phytophthora citrophthora]|uniref:Uncharacterized protein n=1 Tax=Phytophthora citrophthora TaxID=4793 RepID=A0AAD9GJ26_9STRA|nr:hypothetical protein P3T76_008746 [Phytophthora citrophthora]